MFRETIGNKSRKVVNKVERGAVRTFAESIGDPHPIYVDEEVGKASRYGANIAPPTFPRVFGYGEIEGLKLPSKGLIHGEQSYHYTRPLVVGEDITCHGEVKDYQEKAGRSGTMGILTVANFGEDEDGLLVFHSEQVIILTEAVRKGMTV
ncbi:MaoC family dehydratase N-terminal domain-containing protein [Shouchella shacheensis]|uniref:MaoC family dehydratase N-terminal domain-containing protein n=1 Tax=Shouchella shacheensis TaxID=1649580 RepID=UPI0007401311|nr:MaoC family dehydratase N-terminal domain-containing protein [Shouchella shacheensis]